MREMVFREFSNLDFETFNGKTWYPTLQLKPSKSLQ